MRRTIAVAAGAAVSLIALAGTAQAAGATYVYPSDLGTSQTDCGATDSGWCTYTQGTGTVGFVRAVAAAGTPSGYQLQLSTTTGSDKAGVSEYNNRGDQLSSIQGLSYSYLVTANPTADPGPRWAPALNVEIDFNGPTAPGGYAVLVNEPLYHDDYITPTTREWTTNVATDTHGGWWVSGQKGALEAALRQTQHRDADGGATWAEVKSFFPDATVSGIGINQGSGNAGLTSQVDLLTVNDTTYDFAGTPQTADECKNAGWQSYTEHPFPNQGQCIQFANTGRVGTAHAPSGSASVPSSASDVGVASAAAAPAVVQGKMRAA